MEHVSKADLMDDLRSQIGMFADQCKGDVGELYEVVCQKMVRHIEGYLSVSIYLTQDAHFRKQACAGVGDAMPEKVDFGHGLWSIAAVRGGLVCDRLDEQSHVIVPFYQGHHLVGELVVISKPQAHLDDEDVSLFCELVSLFETKVKECNS